MKKLSQILMFVLAMTLSIGSLAAGDWLVISHSTVINAGQKLTLEIIKPGQAAWPQTLKLQLSGSGVTEELELLSEDGQQTTENRRSFVLVPAKKYVGVIKASLVDVDSNQFLLLAADEAAGPVATVVEPDVGQVDDALADNEAAETEIIPTPRIVLAKPGDEPALSAHEPMYFVLGHDSDHGADARFQLSFKYRLFDPEGIIGGFSPLLSNLYFTYTQTSLWDLGEDSSPFRDTSYRPGLFYQWAGSEKQPLPTEWRVGLEHESNGRSSPESRSIDTAYLIPAWHLDMSQGRRLTFAPKIYHYIDKHENRDIQRFRGYVDWNVRYGREDGLIWSGMYRQGTSGFASGQLDISYPISERIFARTGSFVHLQMFSGYGETLLEFDRDRDTQIRLGISIAR
ncbi:MAG: phospholipase [Betaproteobacteria bacterium HGW-Betaproteobacteria-8]|nr:MAG: phospholipase [Betaproteobacteria bacterium HGW-Betaproteobacteria-8]